MDLYVMLQPYAGCSVKYFFYINLHYITKEKAKKKRKICDTDTFTLLMYTKP